MAVTKQRGRAASCAAFALLTTPAFAAVLPEDRIDVLYHGYDGGGADIKGPSVLVRKGVSNSVSVYANYYVDMVTSATIDVEVQGASEYEEERTEYSVGFDYLANKTTLSLGYTNSSENDYDAETIGFGISQDFFGDLTNVSLGFSYGSNIIRKTEVLPPGEAPFKKKSNNRRYKLAISQILTRNLLVAMNFETVIDQGFLNNPYRQVFATFGPDIITEPEIYPETRNSDAFSIRALYYLPYRASVRGEYRSFSDSWGITADSYEFRYVHPFSNLGITVEAKYRQYEQTASSFYSDLFIGRNESREEFRARDKEMSAFTTDTFGLGVTYELKNWPAFFDRTSFNFYWDHLQFNYDNFRDRREASVSTPVGTEPFYAFDANVYRVFVSFWY